MDPTARGGVKQHNRRLHDDDRQLRDTKRAAPAATYPYAVKKPRGSCEQPKKAMRVRAMSASAVGIVRVRPTWLYTWTGNVKRKIRYNARAVLCYAATT